MNPGKRLRQLQRYRTIASALARNGLGYVSHEMGLTDKLFFFRSEAQKELQAKSLGERIRLLLEELGPTFVKLGQIASTRPDLIPADIVTELERLQDHVPASPFEDVAAILEEDLGAPIDQLFRSFTAEPLAAASIGQVYRATLQDGTMVAIKVQRPAIGKLIETDLDILADWARLAESTMEWARIYRLREIVDELGHVLRRELDYSLEARNAERFIAQSESQEHVHVPEIFWDYCSKRVLTMAYVDGIKLSDRLQLERAGLDTRELADRFATTILHQILVAGLYHGDPHPGNVLALSDGRLALLDFGMVGRLNPSMKKQFVSFVIALRNQSSKGVMRAISSMGVIPEDADMEALGADVDEMREKYYKVPLERIGFGEIVNDLFSLSFRHRIRIPSELTLLGKALLTMEGVVTALDPNFSVFDVAEPLGRKLFLERIDPRNIWRNWVEDVPEMIDLISDVPLSLKQLSRIIRQGKLRVEVASPQVDMLTKKMDRISNRLSLSIVLLSLSILMVGLIIGAALSHTQTMIWHIPIIDIGFIVALVMFLWLIAAMIRSGRI
ncbi:ABC1 kinase family protein [Paenibacillus sacheonensis]|uniref:ABC transporter n=1 Tax=Paenibacillus sacheonensis TaxID=742054 RepID=A0A7X5BZA8_9BACL|nr:AarF/ABC1/UbiB kinase family protein [Paenibacillus sacheonensis]MBM7563420.1 ubiquinone biosynthesis protein [Paenibacillus sacheonensis]NBC68025.1 ABC transporter [Paenibacillus sacheonensis]